MHLASIFDRSMITITLISEGTGDRVNYDLAVDGVKSATLSLQKYFQPTIGLYQDGRWAVWAGSDVAVGWLQAGPFISVSLPEPVHAIYRTGYGWIAVAEISVYVLNESLIIVQRRIHKEVIVKSYWAGSTLVIEDFAGETLRARVDDDAPHISDFEGDAANTPG